MAMSLCRHSVYDAFMYSMYVVLHGCRIQHNTRKQSQCIVLSFILSLTLFHSLLYSAKEDAIAEKIVSEALEYTKECIRRAVERDPRYNGVKRRQQEVKVCHDTLLSFRVLIHHAVCALV